MFRKLGFPAAAAMAMLAALAETGGLLFAVGLMTPLAALGIAIVMLNASSGGESESWRPRSPFRR